MVVRLAERFAVRAPAARVWEFLVDPRRVVGCVPGGELAAVLDERTFDGRVRVRVMGLLLAYGGRVRLDEVDLAARRVRILGAARERTGAGGARLVLDSALAALPDGGTDVVVDARIDVAGPVGVLGRGFLERLGHEVFQEFAAHVAAGIEAEVRAGAAAREPPPPLRAVPIVARALRGWIADALRSGARARPPDDGRTRRAG